MEKKRKRVAKIIFMRISAQMSGIAVSDQQWDVAYRGWLENPALFPMVEACIDAADEILTTLHEDKA